MLLARYGAQGWWPADSAFEIVAGAILVQRTAWRNAEKAIAELKARELLSPSALAAADGAALTELIRPAGFAPTKAQYLQAAARFFADGGGVGGLSSRATAALRDALLGVRGIGPETADSILLYVFDRPVWIADAYAARIFSRLSGKRIDSASQHSLTRPWTAAQRSADLRELHALIVAHAKAHCRTRPVCDDCPLRRSCAHRCAQR